MPLYKFSADPHAKSKFGVLADYAEAYQGYEIHGSKLVPLDTTGELKPPKINDILDSNQMPQEYA
jgi:hypothetical protein